MNFRRNLKIDGEMLNTYSELPPMNEDFRYSEPYQFHPGPFGWSPLVSYVYSQAITSLNMC